MPLLYEEIYIVMYGIYYTYKSRETIFIEGLPISLEIVD